MTDGATTPALIDAASRMISSQCSRMTSMRIGRLNRVSIPQSFDPFVSGGLLNGAETIILEVSKTRHEAESKEIAQGEDVIARAAGVGVMFLDDQGGSMVQKLEDMGRLTHGDLDGHAELIAGAALRQNEIPVGFAERIKPDQGAIVVRRSEQPFAIGVIQEAPSRHCIL
jgi:hypothetical protein